MTKRHRIKLQGQPQAGPEQQIGKHDAVVVEVVEGRPLPKWNFVKLGQTAYDTGRPTISSRKTSIVAAGH
jgi:hypothetical protein